MQTLDKFLFAVLTHFRNQDGSKNESFDDSMTLKLYWSFWGICKRYVTIVFAVKTPPCPVQLV